jgi:hypothetical protein
MARLPDLVHDSQLDVEVRNDCIVHLYFESSSPTNRRAEPREETWKEQEQIGGGGFASVWLQICTNGTKKGEVRAVKKIPVRQDRLRDQTYVRELEAIAKFSHKKV